MKVIDEDWHDEARHRIVPVRIYLPVAKEDDAKQPERMPVIVFSHGLWASRETYGYFGRFMGAHGYLVVAPSHPGSDTEALRETVRKRLTDPALRKGGGDGRPIDRLRRLAEEKKGGEDGPLPEGRGLLMESIDDPANLRDRPRDVSFVIDEIGRNESLRAVADLSRVGVAGHSFGAYTAMAIGGMTVDLPDAKSHSFRDERVGCVLPMSPEGAGTMGITKGSWDHFGAPVLFLTGTKDYGPGERAAEWRREAFDSIKAVNEYLVTLDGATHFTFADRGGDRAAEEAGGAMTDSEKGHHVEMIQAIGLAFFDANLREDVAARGFLRAFASEKHGDCAAEFKSPSKE